MEVLKTTSPSVVPTWPKPRPVNTVPSSRASFATRVLLMRRDYRVGGDDVLEGATAHYWVRAENGYTDRKYQWRQPHGLCGDDDEDRDRGGSDCDCSGWDRRAESLLRG